MPMSGRATSNKNSNGSSEIGKLHRDVFNIFVKESEELVKRRAE